MAKVILLGDLHIGVNGSHPIFLDAVSEFITSTLFPFMQQNRIRTIFQAGDTVDTRKYITAQALSVLREVYLEGVIKNDFHLHTILGNHDVVYRNTNALSVFDQIFKTNPEFKRNITVYSEPTRVCEFDDFDTPVDFLPWINEENAQRTFNLAATPGAVYAIAHLELKGFAMYKNILMKRGLDGAKFKEYDRVFTGHYHTISRSGNIQYIGAPGEYTWSDANDPRGFFVLDTESGEVQFHQNPIKMYHTITYDDIDQSYSAKDITALAEPLAQRHVKLTVTGKSKPKTLDKVIGAIEAANPLSFSVFEEVSEVAEEFKSAADESKQNELIDESSGSLLRTEEIIKKYSPSDRIYDKMIDIYRDAVAIGG